MTTNNIEQVGNWIRESKYLVVFTGAGISTASGLPDFRGPDGIWTRRDKGLKPKPMIKRWSEFEPNNGHKTLVELQNMGIMKYLISQNVDGLHIKSGINPELIAELHGNSNFFKCIKCDQRFHEDEIGWDRNLHGNGYRTQKEVPGQPLCTECGSRIISSIVNFEDPMPSKEMELANFHTSLCDVFLVVGSSLMVQPAASFPYDADKNGAKLIIINQGETGLDQIADVKMEGDCSVVLPKILKIVKN